MGNDPMWRTGKVDFGGIIKEVSLAYVPEVQIGEYVIVHVGFALSRLDENEAKKVFQYLKEMDELTELNCNDSVDLGSATVPVALAGVPPASLTMAPPTPISEEAGAERIFGETPKTAVETTALPVATEPFRLRGGGL